MFSLRPSPSLLSPFIHHTRAEQRASLLNIYNDNDFIPDIDDLHKEIDHHKDDQLRKQKEGKGHWKAELASQSEAAVGVFFSFFSSSQGQDLAGFFSVYTTRSDDLVCQL